MRSENMTSISNYRNTISQTTTVEQQLRANQIKKQSKNTSDSAIALLQATTGTGTSTATDPLDSLVTTGTITKDQQDAIKSAFEAARMAFKTQAGATSAEIGRAHV